MEIRCIDVKNQPKNIRHKKSLDLHRDSPIWLMIFFMLKHFASQPFLLFRLHNPGLL